MNLQECVEHFNSTNWINDYTFKCWNHIMDILVEEGKANEWDCSHSDVTDEALIEKGLNEHGLRVHYQLVAFCS